MITLYTAPTPNGRKISVALEEMALPYQATLVNLLAGDQKKPDFLALNPNGRIPVIVDHDDGDFVVFESGAILQYLGRKTGKFYPTEERARVACEEWLFWQVGGLGPKAGQCHHFRIYAPEQVPYAIARYTNEVNRLYGVMNRRLEGRDYLAGAYSIADMACIGWARAWERQGQTITDFPHLERWIDRMLARPAVARGLAVDAEARQNYDLSKDKDAQAVLFGQKAR